ncbi:hypothetical protein DH2020_020896 [Rehmannia glutinosa]|uniref:Uncharacterized protein n=1 Tax=Rehmannia glutinosa TaxID=99300 RepID=A0ABR0WBS9_REHGL
MEYIGRRIKKEISGRPTFFGTVQSYSPATGIFTITYDCGSSEQLNLSEVSPLLLPPPEHMPEKRRRIDGDGEGDSGNLRGFDLNEGVNLELLDLNIPIIEESSGVNNEIIDLNVGVNENSENVGGKRRVNWFDLNVELTEDEPVNEEESQLIIESGSGKSEELVVLPSSSSGLDINGVSIFDVVSVYAFLRSFSTLLFLSPFELGDFVTSLKCDDSTPLFDNIHVALLRALRIHLKSLPKKALPNSASARDCLRSLNWEFLDLITWPVFLVEYLLTHSPRHIPGLNLGDFEPFQSDYYKMPVSAKVEILRHLCDDVVEADAFRSEINRRTSTPEQPDQNKFFDSSEKMKAAMDVDGETGDLNGEECYLCKMDGELICCDGCPAACHSRCVGVVSSQLSDGDWYCPECAFDRNEPRNKVGRSIRGAELLGADPHGRMTECCDDEYSFWFYKRNDLPVVIEALESSPLLYNEIISSICKQWDVTHRTEGTRRILDSRSYSTQSAFREESQINVMPETNKDRLAQTASSVSEELTSKLSDTSSKDATRSAEEITAGQLKIFSNRSAEFFSWSNIESSNGNLKKEKCGWCVYCKEPEEDRNCLFIMKDSGLLLGPWLNPHHSQIWRKSVIEAADLGSVKDLLLELGSNLHHRSLSADWNKHVDTAATMGSASHTVRSIKRVASKHGTKMSKRKCSKEEITRSSKSATGLDLFWWRGGNASRNLFNWKVLPRSVAAKAARQGGYEKISGVHYPDSGNAKRMKYTAWRAAVEQSRSVEQLALQACLSPSLIYIIVRELDANIKWDDIGNSRFLEKMDKESKKRTKSFKKVIIRRKCCKGKVVRYLLDFGKRRSIPDVVVKHGSALEDSSSKRKKYWLEEAHVPLHLLKAFEEKRIARKSNKAIPEELGESMKKPLQKKGFDYLFSKAERSENYQCGHCNEDVPIREAVTCQDCKGFFHERHAQESGGSTTVESTYTCHKCQDAKKNMQVDSGKGKPESSKRKKTTKELKTSRSRKGKKKMKNEEQPEQSKEKTEVPLVVPLRRSARSSERFTLLLQSLKANKRKRNRPAKPETGELKKSNVIRRKKRAPLNSSYWLSGLQLSRRTDDERSRQFRSKMLLVISGEETAIKPTCSLCGEEEYTSNRDYVACEICRVWFHADALGLGADKIRNIIGFKCHHCLNKRTPICPHHCPTGRNNMEESAGLPHPDDRSIPTSD